jgi:hypothetical protein
MDRRLSMEGRIYLAKSHFSQNQTVVCETGRLKASCFVFTTGVHALRLESPRGHIIVLPYQGQQIWDAAFDGRRLTMKSFFPEPVPSGDLLASYGAFLYHCGARRMGSPGPEDEHPLHGELPAASYEQIWVCFGEEAGEPYLGVSGSFTYARAFGDKYHAVPLVKLFESRSVLDVSMTIENLTHYPMELMYMCHINFLPAENGEIVQAAGWSAEDMVLRSRIPSHVRPTPEYLKLLEQLKKDPSMTRTVRPADEYDPEVVFYLRNLKHDRDGSTHIIQKHPDGSSDYVGYDVKQLDHTVRWIVKHRDQQVMGMALPSTCDPEGYTAEKKKGNVRTLPPQSTVTFKVRTGYLDGAHTKEMERKILSLR